MNLEEKAKKIIEEYQMINKGDKILVAFSGGSDSSALLFFLLEYMKNLGENIHDILFAAHMNHMIRGKDADDDEKFAVETCGKYNIKIFTEHRNIPEIAKNPNGLGKKKSIEEAARDERYDFLSKTAELIGGNVKIATAHTASDNTETIIFNLARGSGITGLSGISPVNRNIIRPLLSCSKEDINEYCVKNNIAYVEDITNADEHYTRNFIRHSIAKKLKEKFNGIDENIFKTSEIMRDNADFLNSCVEDILKDKTDNVDIVLLMSKHKTLRRAVISKLYENAVLPDVKKLEYKHVLYIERLLETKTKAKTNKSIDLPGLVTAEISGNILSFKKIKDKKTSGRR